MEIVRMGRAQLKQAANVFFKAFYNYPQMVYYFPDEVLRQRYLEWYFSCVLDYALRYGEVHLNPDVTAFAAWIPPERTSASMWGYIRSGFLLAPIRFGIKKYMRVVDCEDYTGKIHKELMPGPHYYVWGLGVDPLYQGRGIGTALLQPGLATARAKSLPVYLETHDPKNIRFYEKLGFEMIREDSVPQHNLPFWCFRLQP